MDAYLHRLADDSLPLELSATGALLIVGPKWCGKTTTARRHVRSAVYMQDLSAQEQNIALAKADPKRFLAGVPPMLIDEWQTIPFIWDAIRFEIDQRGGALGQFILTGSAVAPAADKIQHSGAGRISRFIMRPMSLFESLDSVGTISLADLFAGQPVAAGTCTKKLSDYARLLCRGGWPLVVGKEPRLARKMTLNFYDTLVESDISRVDGAARSPDRARNLLKAYARAVAT